MIITYRIHPFSKHLTTSSSHKAVHVTIPQLYPSQRFLHIFDIFSYILYKSAKLHINTNTLQNETLAING